MTTALKVWFGSIATTFANVGALLVFAIIYAVILVASYLFISVREATLWQVFVTYALMILIPFGFVFLQSSIINRELDQKFRWRAIVIDALKFLVVSILILLVVWSLYYLLGKLSARYPAPIVEVPATTQPTPISSPTPQPTPQPTVPLHWPSLIFTTLRFVLIGVAFPLASIHLWILVAGGEFGVHFTGGAKSFLKRTGLAIVHAFSAESVLVYGLGLLIFFVVPYVILVPTFKLGGNKTEFAVFGLRLLFSFLFSLVGWVTTLTALVRLGTSLTPEVSAPAVAPQTEATA